MIRTHEDAENLARTLAVDLLRTHIAEVERSRTAGEAKVRLRAHIDRGATQFSTSVAPELEGIYHSTIAEVFQRACSLEHPRVDDFGRIYSAGGTLRVSSLARAALLVAGVVAFTALLGVFMVGTGAG